MIDTVAPFEIPKLSSSPGTLENPELNTSPTESSGHVVIVFNNDHNTYEEVTVILMVATHCTEEEAYIEAWEIDHYGSSRVFFGPEEDCNAVAEIIRQIGIEVRVDTE